MQKILKYLLFIILQISLRSHNERNFQSLWLYGSSAVRYYGITVLRSIRHYRNYVPHNEITFYKKSPKA